MSGGDVEGRDPVTGRVVRVAWRDGVLTAVDDCGEGTDAPWLLPGLVDLQVNGFAGHDVNAADVSVATLAAITDELIKRGVTTWVPTLITAGEEELIMGLQVIARARAADPALARAMPFAHVEGPFISSLDGPRGVHDATMIRKLDANEVARWSAHGPVGILTVSPHSLTDSPDDPDAAQIARIVASGVVVAVGHTHADATQVHRAARAGASLSTHLGNGIFTSLPRHPNAIWAQLGDDAFTCGLIGDGFHLPADTLTAMVRAKGPGRAFLVSDATTIAGLPPGRYTTPVGGDVELTPAGRLSPVGSPLLAGAGVDLAHGLRFVARQTPLGLATAVDLAGRVPGRIADRGVSRPRGTVAVGHPADLLTLDDDLGVDRVWRAGRAA